MKNLFGALVVLFSLGLSSLSHADTTGKVLSMSAWTNQSGSILYINSVASNGQLTGTYINRAKGYGCQNIPYPVTGWVYGTAITFTTIWRSAKESCNSITAWTGFYYQGQIHTLWQLVVNGSSSIGQIVQGTDTFKPTASEIHKSLIMKK